MASRTRFWISSSSLAAAVAAACLVGPRGAAAQDAPAAADPVPNGPFTFAGAIKTDAATVKSGFGDNDYPVVKLKIGTTVTVVGKKDDWLKIEPPADAFCLVPQAFVDKFGNGRMGRVVNNPATVRIGSAIVPASRYKTPLRLPIGSEVQILGTEDEYYKIVPPKGVYLYIDKGAVDPVRRLDVNPPVADAAKGQDEGKTPDAAKATDAGKPPVADAGTAPKPDAGRTSTGAGQVGGDRFVARSTTAPSDVAEPAVAASSEKVRALQEELVKVDDRYAAASKLEISEQPIDALMADFQKLLDDPALPPNARRIAEFRVETLRVRKEAAEQLAEARKNQAEAAERQAKLEAERQKLAADVAEKSVKHYDAIGKLATSSLRAGGEPLYRLVDPATGRTILYVRAASGQSVSNVNDFVAISGKVVKDEAMKITYVEPTAIEPAQAAQVNKKIFADYSPPSLAAANVATGESAN